LYSASGFRHLDGEVPEPEHPVQVGEHVLLGQVGVPSRVGLDPDGVDGGEQLLGLCCVEQGHGVLLGVVYES
jgi:hypothetical protein